MRIASGNELSPQSMPDMESSDCCSQSGRDMLFQNWFNLKFAGLPEPGIFFVRRLLHLR